MEKSKISLLGVGVTSLNKESILEEIRKWLENGPKIYQIFTPNPEILVLAQKNKAFAQILHTADLALPDGQGLIWAGKILQKSLPEKISGSDFLENLVEIGVKKGVAIGLIGGGSGIALRALECLQKTYPHLNGWAEEGPKIKIEDSGWQIEDRYDLNRLINKIRDANTGIIFVGMGAPKQEYFINKIAQLLNCSIANNLTMEQSNNRPIVLMAVGGTFDYLSGKVPRAPERLRRIGLEWLYRLLRQPARIKRQLSLLEFIALVLKEKLKPS